MEDVIVVGGSYAGMAAALQLVRARRRVRVIDAGARRNRFSRRSHGFLGRDGADAAEIAATARRQLEAYPTLSWTEGLAVSVSGRKDAFEVATAAGDTLSARRLILAIGVADGLPSVPGLAERWGTSVFHCPYCHGYELAGGEVGVIATGPQSVQQAELLSEWGAVTFLTNGALTLDPSAQESLQARDVSIEETPIAGIAGDANVVLADGRRRVFAGLFTGTRSAPATSIAEAMGCALSEAATDVQIRTDDTKETSVPGVFACGDVALATHSVSLAVADGALAGTEVHRSLVWPLR